MSESYYHSSTVGDLEDFSSDNLTDGDLMLRIEDGGKELRSQTVANLLHLYSTYASRAFSVEIDGMVKVCMDEILQSYLDWFLLKKQEFANWKNGITDEIAFLNSELDEIERMLDSVKPLTYVGRIIISTTDDIESKVIRNYGGRRWKRVMNFLRGVDESDSELGVKHGEAFVALRSANVANHSHGANASYSDDERVELGVGSN